MTSEVIEIFHKDRIEAIEIINTGGSIVNFMTRKTPVCGLVDSEIVFEKILGKGVQGVALLISFKGISEKKYVAKLSNGSVEIFDPKKSFTSFSYYDLSKKFNIPINTLLKINKYKGQIDKIVSDPVIIPLFATSCIQNDNVETFYRVDNDKEIPYNPKITSVCHENNSEFPISLLVAEEYRNGTSINFLDIFDFATCERSEDEKNPIKQYTFMQMITTTLRKAIKTDKNINKETIDIIAFQILHAILVYQDNHEIVHGDLHTDNVFLEKITKDMIWNDQDIGGAEYYAYKIDNIIFSFPARLCPYIVKIGDWGLACKYSSPMILDYKVMIDGLDQEDGDGPWLPNFYSALYDPYFIISNLYGIFKTNFLKDLMMSMLHVDKDNGLSKNIYDGGVNITVKGNGRPMVKMLNKNPWKDFSIRENLFFSDYSLNEYSKIPPKGSKVAILGIV